MTQRAQHLITGLLTRYTLRVLYIRRPCHESRNHFPSLLRHLGAIFLSSCGERSCHLKEAFSLSCMRACFWHLLIGLQPSDYNLQNGRVPPSPSMMSLLEACSLFPVSISISNPLSRNRSRDLKNFLVYPRSCHTTSLHQ
jgi:hypothetical protein